MYILTIGITRIRSTERKRPLQLSFADLEKRESQVLAVENLINTPYECVDAMTDRYKFRTDLRYESIVFLPRVSSSPLPSTLGRSLPRGDPRVRADYAAADIKSPVSRARERRKLPGNLSVHDARVLQPRRGHRWEDAI